ncbi:MAG: NADH-quinone oxidoreductase subunit C, partial [Paracoccaceae bacterium]
MIEALHDLAEYVEQKRSDCVISWDVMNGELNISVAPSNIASFVEFLRADNRCKFSTLVDI